MKTIAVTGGGGQLAYSFLFRIANGDVFGNEELVLKIHDLEAMHPVLEGVAMELEDAAFSRLLKVEISSDLYKVFDKADLAVLIGAKPRGAGMERADLLEANGKIFVEQGVALNEAANQNVKVLVVGNPCNTNALIAMHHAPKISKRNFHAMLRLDQNRASALLAKKAGVPVKQISNVIVWGNHSATQVPDITHAKIDSRPAREVISDQNWIRETFVTTVQKRGAAVIQARGKSSAGSAASGIIDALRSLYTPTPTGEFFSSGVCSDGNPYGIEEGIIFGFPCRSKGNGDYEIIPYLEWEHFIAEMIAVTQKELVNERECVI